LPFVLPPIAVGGGHRNDRICFEEMIAPPPSPAVRWDGPCLIGSGSDASTPNAAFAGKPLFFPFNGTMRYEVFADFPRNENFLFVSTIVILSYHYRTTRSSLPLARLNCGWSAVEAGSINWGKPCLISILSKAKLGTPERRARRF
jgi:hypothetical protein